MRFIEGIVKGIAKGIQIIDKRLLISSDVCDICGNKISRPFSEWDYKAFPCFVCMCQNCGLVKLNPRWSKKKYEAFYRTSYDAFYRDPDVPLDRLFEQDVLNKGAIVASLLSDVSLPQRIKMLDIGAGNGFSFEIVQRLYPQMFVEKFAMEMSKKCMHFLEKKGVTLLGNNFYEISDNTYDLIICRHVLEHTLDPVEYLKVLRRALMPQGYLYLEVPNLLSVDPKKMHSFFRHVHTYYFNPSTILLMCKQAGLYCLKMHTEDRIAVILQLKDTGFEIPPVSCNDIEKRLPNKALYNCNRLPLRFIRKTLKRIMFGEIAHF